MVAARTQLEATALAWRPHRVYVTASLLRSYGGYTALVLRFHGVLLIQWRSHREYTELPRRSLRSYSVCRALKQRCQCVVRKPNKNGINTASSLSPHFCARPLDLIGLLLAYMQVQEIHDDANIMGLLPSPPGALLLSNHPDVQ